MDSRPGPSRARSTGQEQVRAALAEPPTTRMTWSVDWVTETGSTNRDLLDRAAAGAPEGLVAVTDHQTAGRGTKGRTWFDPPGGSLLVSVLLRPTLRPAHVHLLTMAFGLAAVDACREVTGSVVGLKWPNDLFATVEGAAPFAGITGAAGERKLAGILAESLVSGSTIDAVVVGMGMNVNWPAEVPTDLGELAVALNRVAGAEVDRATLLVALIRAFDAGYDGLGTASGRVAMLDRYRAASVTLGRQVRVELPGGPVRGRAEDVTEEGHLVVVVDGARRTFTAGDVVHLRPVD